MDDLILNITEEGIEGAGTEQKMFYIHKWSDYGAEGECVEPGDVPIGQLDTFISLVGECGQGGEEIELSYADDIITVTGPTATFSMPTVNQPTSQAGVEVIGGFIDASEQDNWETFGKGGTFDYHLNFDAASFQQLRNTGKAIQSGSLYCLEVGDKTLTLSTKRDSVRVDRSLPHCDSIYNSDEPVINWFGQWLMDALKAMPGVGEVQVHGGNHAPLLIRHTAKEAECGYGQTVVISPRQESGANQ